MEGARFLRMGLEKILEYAEPGLPALLRVELGRDDVSSLNAADKVASIVRGRQDIHVLLRDHMVRVDEVEFFVTTKAVEQP
jgi:hypothetical protein